MALPEQYSDFLKRIDPPWFAPLARAMEGAPEVSLRFNRAKPSDAFPEGLPRVPWCERGIYLDERPAFTFDPVLHQGAYYVQDASSMFISHVIGHLAAGSPSPLKVLDACAAPGGKTTAIIDALPAGSLVVANEYVADRAAILRENLAKWGYPLVTVTQGDTARFRDYPGFFDIIAADVPCSGEGMMRKDAVAAAQWSPGLVKQCAERQLEITSNLWPALRPGGYLIYSTCTFNTQENESIIAHLRDSFGAEPVAIPTDSSWNIAPSLDPSIPAYRFIPGLIRGEGLFMAVLRKPLSEDSQVRPQKKKEKRRQASKPATPKLPAEIKNWISKDYPTSFSIEADGRIFAEFSEHPIFTPRLEIGELKGRDVIPSQQLAMSLALNPGAFPTAEVTRPTALDYLRREAIVLPDGSPRGIVLLTYGKRPLGFVKNLGSRANNLYPRPWRILSKSQG